jgi:hypothetical protein
MRGLCNNIKRDLECDHLKEDLYFEWPYDTSLWFYRNYGHHYVRFLSLLFDGLYPLEKKKS